MSDDEGPTQEAVTVGGDMIELWIVEDAEENDHSKNSASIEFYGMSFSFKFKTQEQARAFYDALALCTEIEEL